MGSRFLCISHASALFYWRTNPPWYVLEGAAQNIRSLQGTPQSIEEFKSFPLSEAEFGPEPYDILVPVNAPRCPPSIRRHECKAKLPPHSLYPIHDGIHVVSPELCLVQLCQTSDFIESLELGMELAGFYALRPADGQGHQRDHCLIDPEACRKHYAAWTGMAGLPQARRVARYLVGGAASPMESKMFLMACLPLKYGGYHLPAPELNASLVLPDEGQLLLRQQTVRPDFLWRGGKLVVEYDGAYHDDPIQSRKDAMRKTVIESMGYTVLQVKRWQLYDPLAFDAVVRTIARILGKRLRPLALEQEHARDELRRRLLQSSERSKFQQR